MSNQLTHGAECRNQMLIGVNEIADMVTATLGGKGRTIGIETLIQQPPPNPPYRMIQVTKDGVTVANSVELEDPVQNFGATLVREASRKTVREAGDGTTAAMLLAQTIYSAGLELVNSGANPVFVKEGIERGVKYVVAQLEKLAVPAEGEMLRHVARIAANGDDSIANIVTEAVEKAGKDGIISVDNSKTVDTYLDFSAGMKLDVGFVVDAFANNDRGECVLDKPYVFLHERRIVNPMQIAELLNAVAKSNSSILILSEDFENELLQLLVVNKLNGALKSCCVRAPFFGDRRKAQLQDIAFTVGGTAFTDELGAKLDSITLDKLGRVDKAIITKNSITLIGGAGPKEAVELRAKSLRAQAEKSESDYEKSVLAERLAKLNGGVALIRVGAPTESALKEKKDRVEDSVYAVKAAMDGGVVAGGGYALASIVGDHTEFGIAVGEEMNGFKLLLDACRAPITKIAKNGGYDGDAVCREAIQRGKLFNVLTNDYEDIKETQIIDPKKVVVSALTNAASVAATMLTIEGIVTVKRENVQTNGK